MAISFRELRKRAKAFQMGNLRIAITGDCATQFLVIATKGALEQRGISGDIFEAEYNQVAHQVLTADSDLRKFSPDILIIWETAENWWNAGVSVAERIEQVATYCSVFGGKIIYINTATFNDGVFGSYANAGNSFVVQNRAFNYKLDELAAKTPNLFICDLNSIVADLGRIQAFDAPSYMLGDMVLSPEATAMLGVRIADIIAAMQGRTRKCVIVDLDNTLWGGVIGEDGMSGIQLGEHGVGKAFLRIQRMLKRLKNRGILLAVCSKNDVEIAKEVFEHHPDMILRLNDIACFVANWENKADNISYIQRTLNIGIDSFVFLDDNPAEREIVRLAHPSVAVPELPEDPSLWVEFLARENLFETVSYSAADGDRTDQYRTEIQRREFEHCFADEKSFLRGLEMHATVAKLADFTIPRAAQLSQRSNQFNLRTVRYTEAELSAYAADSNVIQLGFTLADKFGSHGLIAVIVAKKMNEQDLFLESWFMSCRVLKRGMERFMLNHIAALAKSTGFERLIGEYIPTRKNGMVANLYPELGFIALGDNRFELNISNYTEMETQINEN